MIGLNFVQTFAVGALAALILFVLFMMIYGVKNMSLMKQKQIEKNYIIDNMEVGKRVVISNGLIGIITHIAEDEISLDLGNNLIVQAKKHSITQLLN